MKKHLLACVAVTSLLLGAPAFAQFGPPGPQMRGDGPPPAAAPFRIERADPALDAIVAPGTKLVEVAHGFGLNEGPVWVREGKSGYLLVSGLIDNVIYKVTLDGTVSAFMEKAGFEGDDPSHTGFQTRSGRSHVLLIGPSCTGLDSRGRLLWCQNNDGKIMRLEKDGTHTVLTAGTADGKRLSSPNDLTVLRDDTIYFVDNDFGFRDAGKSPEKQLENAVWRLKDGKLTMALSAKDLGSIPNGITISPDEKYLYLSAFTKLKRYEIAPDGTLTNGIVLGEGEGIIDGMKVDTLGNIYSTSGAGPGVVRITSPAGKMLGLLRLPIDGREPKRQICATNVAFGGADNHTLFIAACDAVYSIHLKVAGIAQGPGGRK